MIRFAAALLVALASFAAQAQTTEPIDVVRKFYAQPPVENYTPYSKRLAGLYDAASAKSKELEEPVSGVDFDPTINGQDAEPNFQKTLRYQQTQRGGDRARIKVTFKNGRQSELWFDMILENNRWLVDDIQSVRGEAKWVFSKLLMDGAQGK
ncbi:DUF3828 domain-containing protein [Terrarubrum flagellatum]|uniref:DUF3828 domain-containing protein n=1 Tax=Terrirubrum flagellatum TaxID=2895980 RepID=UPI0031455305